MLQANTMPFYRKDLSIQCLGYPRVSGANSPQIPRNNYIQQSSCQLICQLNILFVCQSFTQPISMDLMNQEPQDWHVQRRESTLLSHNHLNHSFCLIKTLKPIGHPQLRHVTNPISSCFSDQYWHFPWQWGKFSTLFPSTLFRSIFLFKCGIQY